MKRLKVNKWMTYSLMICVICLLNSGAAGYEDVNECLIDPCPKGYECLNIEGGYICRDPVTGDATVYKVSYVVYVPSNDVALLTVDLNPGNSWYCVFLNQETGETGWVFNDNPDAFYTYRRLFYIFKCFIMKYLTYINVNKDLV